MGIHPLLARQLKRLELNQENLPTLEKWQEFINSIDRNYQNTDQERYLNQLSIEISSREMSELTTKLERAQQIAHLGYWDFDSDTKRISWSKEMYRLFGDDPAKKIPAFEEIMNRFNENDKKNIMDLIDRAIQHGEDYEYEAQMKKGNGEVCWFYLAGHPHVPDDGTPTHHISGIVIDINRRKLSETKLQEMNQQLVSSARRAGMAEIATSVLHNIGNVLNSMNISVEVIQHHLKKINYENFGSAIQMVLGHLSNLPEYFKNDPKGKILPKYLIESAKMIHRENERIKQEMKKLTEHVAHIKSIVKMQNLLSGVSSSVIEKLSVCDIIEAALLFNEASFAKYKIIIEKNWEEVPDIYSDKNKILQILINLIQNAKDAILAKNPKEKQIIINVHLRPDNNNVEISIIDNGVGISLEELKNIFAFGFTTKSKGHGFGLHTSILLAKDLGGTLHASSKGPGKGANFSLRLPLMTVAKGSDIYERQV